DDDEDQGRVGFHVIAPGDTLGSTVIWGLAGRTRRRSGDLPRGTDTGTAVVVVVVSIPGPSPRVWVLEVHSASLHRLFGPTRCSSPRCGLESTVDRVNANSHNDAPVSN